VQTKIIQIAFLNRLYCGYGITHQKWTQSRIRSPDTFFGPGFEILEKTGPGAGFSMCGLVYIAI